MKPVNPRPNKYLIPDLAVGESLIVPYFDDPPSPKEIEKLRQAFYGRNGGSYRTRRTDMGLYIKRIK